MKNVSVTWVEYISDGEGCQPHQTTLRWLVDANVSSYKRILRFQAIWFPVHISTCEKRQYNHIYIWLGSCYCETLTILVEVKLTLEVLESDLANLKHNMEAKLDNLTTICYNFGGLALTFLFPWHHPARGAESIVSIHILMGEKTWPKNIDFSWRKLISKN